jgi:hypothetical protein
MRGARKRAYRLMASLKFRLDFLRLDFLKKRRSSWRFGRSRIDHRRFLSCSATPFLSGLFCPGARLRLHLFGNVSQIRFSRVGSRCRIVQPFHNDNGQLMLESNLSSIGFMWSRFLPRTIPTYVTEGSFHHHQFHVQ